MRTKGNKAANPVQVAHKVKIFVLRYPLTQIGEEREKPIPLQAPIAVSIAVYDKPKFSKKNWGKTGWTIIRPAPPRKKPV